MKLSSILPQQRVVAALEVSCQKRLMQEVADRFATSVGLTEREVFMSLVARERLGSTAVGRGVAMPHARFPELDSLKAIFIRLAEPLDDFETPDDQPVDLVMVLLAPEGNQSDHIRAMASIARVLRDKDLCDKLRGALTSEIMYAMLTEEDEETRS